MKRKITLIFILLIGTAAYANLRAPRSLFRLPSYAMSKSGNELVVKKESLDFLCPESSSPDIKDSTKNTDCKVTAVYEVESEKSLNYSFEFISPSGEETQAKVNSEGVSSVKPEPLVIKIVEFPYNEEQNIKNEDSVIYRFSQYCRGSGCQSDQNKLYRVVFPGKLEKGLNTIKVEYKQPVGANEEKYGYVTTSKWSNQISYELWPLKEWKFDKDFSIAVKFSTINGGFFKRLFSDNVGISCIGANHHFKTYPYSILKKKYTVAEVGDGIKRDKDGDEIYSADFIDKISTVNQVDDRLVYEVSFKSSFPDRLICSYGYLRSSK